MQTFTKYLNSHTPLILPHIENLIENLYETILSTLNSDYIVYTIGNGGSHSTAEHFSADLNLNFKRTGNSIKSICVSSQIAFQTAISNDESYESALSLYLENFIKKNDLLIAFTASGNSENIIRAVSTASQYKAIVYVFSGFSGGKILNLGGINNIHVKSADGMYGEIENLHLMFCHYIIDKLKARIK